MNDVISGLSHQSSLPLELRKAIGGIWRLLQVVAVKLSTSFTGGQLKCMGQEIKHDSHPVI